LTGYGDDAGARRLLNNLVSRPGPLGRVWDDLGVQGSSGLQRELWDVQAVAGHLLPAGSVFAFLADHREVLFPDVMLADLFPSGRGRPSVAGPVVAAVLVLQALHGLSDREAAEAVTFDLRWKAACGFAVTAAAFHPTTLTYWRRRLGVSSAPERIFEAVRAVVPETGVLAAKTRRALDFTILDDAVATRTPSRSWSRRSAGSPAPSLAASGWSPRWRRRPGTTTPGRASHKSPGTTPPPVRSSLTGWSATPAVLAAVAELTDDGIVLDQAAADAVGLLGLVAGQDVEWITDTDASADSGPAAAAEEGDGGSWRIARKVAADRVISTVDPQARHAHKTTSRRQDGFKAHVGDWPSSSVAASVRSWASWSTSGSGTRSSRSAGPPPARSCSSRLGSSATAPARKSCSHQASTTATRSRSRGSVS